MTPQSDCGDTPPSPVTSTLATVLIADDHAVVMEGLSSAISSLGGFAIAGRAEDGAEALRKVAALRPNIVIMDVSMPNMNGIEATTEIKRSYPATKVIIYTMHSDREYVLKLLEAGMDGYVLKQDPVADLLRALESVQAGGTYFSTEVPKILSEHLRSATAVGPDKQDLALLSKREVEVFTLLADGESVKDIAATLFLSPKTVESHKYNIMAKLHLSSTVDMTKLAIRLGLIRA